MIAHHEHNAVPVEFFPGTSEIVPANLTATETVRLLRLDRVHRPGTNGQEPREEERAMADGLKSLDHLVRKQWLKPQTLSKSRTFSRRQVLDLIENGPPQEKKP